MAEGDHLLGLFPCLRASCSPAQVLGDREEVAHSLEALRMQREEALRQSKEISLNFDSTQSEVRWSDKMHMGPIATL